MDTPWSSLQLNILLWSLIGILLSLGHLPKEGEKSVPLAISVVIIAKNEHGRIKECIESVHGWADEIVVVDDESTDDTRAIALKYTDMIFTRHMELEGKQRNFGAARGKKWLDHDFGL